MTGRLYVPVDRRVLAVAFQPGGYAISVGFGMKYQPIRKQLERSHNKSETLRWWFRRFMKRKKVLFPDDAGMLLSKIKTMACGHWFREFNTDAIYVYYESGRWGANSDGVKIYSIMSIRFEFKRKHRKDKLAMMHRVVQIEMEHKKQGNERWEKWV